MSSKTHDYPLMILERHLDTFGHVNNATYLQLLEEARWQWITEGGYGIDKIKQTRKGPTILECKLEFRRELINREPILIRSWVESYVGRVGVVRQQILKNGGVLSCEAEFVMGLFDTEARKLIDPTDEWLACVGWTRDEWSPKSA